MPSIPLGQGTWCKVPFSSWHFFFFLVASPGTTVRAICVISDFFSKLEFFYMVKLRVVPQRFRQAPKGRANKKIVSYFHDLFSV